MFLHVNSSSSLHFPVNKIEYEHICYWQAFLEVCSMNIITCYSFGRYDSNQLIDLSLKPSEAIFCTNISWLTSTVILVRPLEGGPCSLAP